MAEGAARLTYHLPEGHIDALQFRSPAKPLGFRQCSKQVILDKIGMKSLIHTRRRICIQGGSLHIRESHAALWLGCSVNIGALFGTLQETARQCQRDRSSQAPAQLASDMFGNERSFLSVSV